MLLNQSCLHETQQLVDAHLGFGEKVGKFQAMADLYDTPARHSAKTVNNQLLDSIATQKTIVAQAKIEQLLLQSLLCFSKQ